MPHATFSSGTIQALKPRIEFTNGYDPMSSRHRQAHHPVQSGKRVYSGMLISPVWNSSSLQSEWVPGLVADATPYVAVQHDDDRDVIGAGGKVTGIPLTDDVSFFTPWVVTGTLLDPTAAATSWDSGRSLTGFQFDGTEAHRGKFAIAATTNRVLGTIGDGHANGLYDLAPENFSVVRDGDGKVLVGHVSAGYVAENLKA